MAEMIEWAQYDHLLGTDHDHAIAAIIGCTVWAVGKRRRKLRILASNRYAGTPSWLPVQLLGIVSDREIAQRTGKNKNTILHWRQKLCIDPLAQKRIDRRTRQKIISLLGKESDGSIARRFGISGSRVQSIRAKLQIPAFNKET